MNYYLKKHLKKIFCNSYDGCALNSVLDSNEKLHKALKKVKREQENAPIICDYVDEFHQAIQIDLSCEHNGIVYVTQEIKANKVIAINVYGLFGINKSYRAGDRNIVFLELKYDTDDIFFCHILDFQCRGNCGYGTIMMKCVLNYLTNYKVAYISGYVSPVDSKDTSDKQHSERLHHFYQKFGFKFYWKGRDEYLRLDLQDKKFCSKAYIENTIYEIENNCYRNVIQELLISKKIQMSDLHQSIRINNPNLYILALKVDAAVSVKRMLEDFHLLCSDIDSLPEDNTAQRENLLLRLYSFFCPIRYHKSNNELIAFEAQIRQKYKMPFDT